MKKYISLFIVVATLFTTSSIFAQQSRKTLTFTLETKIDGQVQTKKVPVRAPEGVELGFTASATDSKDEVIFKLLPEVAGNSFQLVGYFLVKEDGKTLTSSKKSYETLPTSKSGTFHFDYKSKSYDVTITPESFR